ncbi:hypothetical protein DMA11_05770 [Marinilabiliaceae bacterium JC017]|nr:hypothetical protein DMA11_05770 [Marinilabiliaceae bacterium JC017]
MKNLNLYVNPTPAKETENSLLDAFINENNDTLLENTEILNIRGGGTEGEGGIAVQYEEIPV